MRIIKALLVLVFLLPTLATAQPTPESFIRIERDENRDEPRTKGQFRTTGASTRKTLCGDNAPNEGDATSDDRTTVPLESLAPAQDRSLLIGPDARPR